MKNKMHLATVDLFAGCGGMSLGFQLENFNIIEAYDNWQPAISCYKANFNHPIYNTDLSNTQSIIPKLINRNLDLIIGGPPCQEFSSAGKRTEGTLADLTIVFASIVSEVKPKYFVMENVERTRNSFAYQKAREIFYDAGYGLTEVTLNAALCNVPQRRKRFFSIGSLCDKDNFLRHILDNNLSKKEMTVRDYFGKSLDLNYYYRHPRNYNRRGIFSTDEPSPTVRGVNRPVPAGYKGHSADPVKLFKGLRPLTSKERSMIQTFPSDFVLPEMKTDCEQLVGNAVPVNLARFIARALKSHINL